MHARDGLEGVKASKDYRPMRASRVLQKCLFRSLTAMHQMRARVLLRAVEALLAGRRLTLMDVARSWPGAERVRAPLKAFDRLLSNPHLYGEREALYADMARWLLRSPQPVIVIDWSDLKPDKSWGLLRAAVPVGGRTLPILDMVFPGNQTNSPTAERCFLARLRAIVPAHATPILVTDAGFHAPWFRAVSALGWHWLGRLRHSTLVKPIEALAPADWVPSRALYELLDGYGTRDLGSMHMVHRTPWACRLIIHRNRPRGVNTAPSRANPGAAVIAAKRQPANANLGCWSRRPHCSSAHVSW